jgi:hypothetical protein
MTQYKRTFQFPAGIPADGGKVQHELQNIQTVQRSMYVQSITTNSLANNQEIYHGWGFIAGDGDASTTIVITLPNGGYDSAAYDVFVHILGTKNNSDPTSRADVDASAPHNLTSFNATSAQTATQFQIVFADVDATTIAATRRILFSWMTIGTKA